MAHIYSEYGIDPIKDPKASYILTEDVTSKVLAPSKLLEGTILEYFYNNRILAITVPKSHDKPTRVIDTSFINEMDLFREISKWSKNRKLIKIEEKTMKKVQEKADVKKIIKDIVDKDLSGSNEQQGAFAEMIKGLAFSDDPLSNEFMKKVDKAVTKIANDVLKKEETIIEIEKEIDIIQEDKVITLEPGDKIKVITEMMKPPSIVYDFYENKVFAYFKSGKVYCSEPEFSYDTFKAFTQSLVKAGATNGSFDSGSPNSGSGKEEYGIRPGKQSLLSRFVKENNFNEC